MLYNPPGPGNEREPNETNWSRTWSHLNTPFITSIHAVQGLGEPLPGQFGDAKSPNFSRYAVILNAEARHMQLQDAVSMFWILLVVFGASLICLYCDLGTATTHFGICMYLLVNFQCQCRTDCSGMMQVSSLLEECSYQDMFYLDKNLTQYWHTLFTF